VLVSAVNASGAVDPTYSTIVDVQVYEKREKRERKIGEIGEEER
jgi:hypothetical protein